MTEASRNERKGKRARSPLEVDSDGDGALPTKKALAISASTASTTASATASTSNRTLTSSPTSAGSHVPSTSALPVQPSRAGALIADDLLWLKIASKVPLIHGLFGPPLACFDVDGTLISSISGAIPPDNRHDWKLWCSAGSVQTGLREYHATGFAIVFVSKQGYGSKSSEVREFKCKMALIGRAQTFPFAYSRLPPERLQTFIASRESACGRQSKRHLPRKYRLDKSASFYVGDAAGRPGDFASTDKEWAQNVGIPFYTPEQFFWERKDERAIAAL